MIDPHVPLATRRYTLTTADAVAYESLRREMQGWRKVLFLGWLGLAGAYVGLLPPELVGDEYGWRFWLLGAAFIGIHWLIAALLMTVRRYNRARRRIPRPVEVELQEWGDHLTAQQGDRHIVLAYEATNPILTDTHLFVEAKPEVIIIPRRVFDDPNEAEALMEAIESAGRDTT